MIRIFIGYDSRQKIALSVLAHSIWKRSSYPVSITPLNFRQLKSLHNRTWDVPEYSEFSYTRFLVPYLSRYEGFSLFMDCDMLNLRDISSLWNLADPRYSVQVVKHPNIEQPAHTEFGLQDHYPKKYW